MRRMGRKGIKGESLSMITFGNLERTPARGLREPV